MLPVMKTCPSCKGQLRKVSTVCSYCGYDYSAASPEFSEPEPLTPETNSGGVPGRNPKALAALIFGVLGFTVLGAALAVAYGRIARREIGEANEAAGHEVQTGAGIATAGEVLGWVFLVWFILAIVALLSESGL